jgi:hypothetical protein
LLDFAEDGELVDGLLVGRLEQRPAGVLDPLAGLGVGALMRVSLVAADLVDGALGEADDVEGVEGDLGAGDVVADRFLISAAHVDRDGPEHPREHDHPRAAPAVEMTSSSTDPSVSGCDGHRSAGKRDSKPMLRFPSRPPRFLFAPRDCSLDLDAAGEPVDGVGELADGVEGAAFAPAGHVRDRLAVDGESDADADAHDVGDAVDDHFGLLAREMLVVDAERVGGLVK